jgi:hypothetical protein
MGVTFSCTVEAFMLAYDRSMEITDFSLALGADFSLAVVPPVPFFSFISCSPPLITCRLFWPVATNVIVI